VGIVKVGSGLLLGCKTGLVYLSSVRLGYYLDSLVHSIDAAWEAEEVGEFWQNEEGLKGVVWAVEVLQAGVHDRLKPVPDSRHLREQEICLH